MGHGVILRRSLPRSHARNPAVPHWRDRCRCSGRPSIRLTVARDGLGPLCGGGVPLAVARDLDGGRDSQSRADRRDARECRLGRARTAVALASRVAPTDGTVSLFLLFLLLWTALWTVGGIAAAAQLLRSVNGGDLVDLTGPDLRLTRRTDHSAGGGTCRTDGSGACALAWTTAAPWLSTPLKGRWRFRSRHIRRTRRAARLAGREPGVARRGTRAADGTRDAAARSRCRGARSGDDPDAAHPPRQGGRLPPWPGGWSRLSRWVGRRPSPRPDARTGRGEFAALAATVLVAAAAMWISAARREWIGSPGRLEDRWCFAGWTLRRRLFEGGTTVHLEHTRQRRRRPLCAGRAERPRPAGAGDGAVRSVRAARARRVAQRAQGFPFDRGPL